MHILLQFQQYNIRVLLDKLGFRNRGIGQCINSGPLGLNDLDDLDADSLLIVKELTGEDAQTDMSCFATKKARNE
jgi:hypothetical protein